MISITISKDKNGYRSLKCSGHALYAESGSDIVCASVSVLVINTINGIDQFTEDSYSLDTDEESGLIHLIFTDNVSDESELLMDVLCMGLKEIARNYGDAYLTLKFEEV